MEAKYTAYTKVLENKTFYFVKKFSIFPEVENIPPILEAYGMHTDFEKACTIALLNDPAIKKQLLSEIEGNNQLAKVVNLNSEIVNKKRAQ